MIYDVVIIGAGPSGSVLGKYLDKNLNVLIIDKRNLNETNEFQKQKCCGVSLAESLNQSLVNFGPLYNRKTLKLKRNLLVKNLKVLIMYQPLIRKIVMLSGVLSMMIKQEHQ